MVAQIIRFCVVGGLATFVHMIVAISLVHAGARLGVWAVNLISFTAAVWVSFLGHRYFTFKSDGSAVKFVVTAMVGFAVNNICLTLVYWLTNAELPSIIVAATLSPAVVFFISRLWVFR